MSKAKSRQEAPRSKCKSTPQLSIDDITYNSSVLLSGKSSTFTGFVIPLLSQLTLKVLSLSSQLHFGGQVKERLILDPSKNSVTKMRCLKTAFIMARRQCQKFLSVRWIKNIRPSHTHQWKLSNHFCYNIADKIRRDSQRLKLVNIFQIDFCEPIVEQSQKKTHLYINQMSMRKNVALRGRSGENWTSCTTVLHLQRKRSITPRTALKTTLILFLL